MSKVYLEGKVLIGDATEGLILVYNRSDMPKMASWVGTMLGGKERAWVDPTDKCVQKGLRIGYFKVINDDKVESGEIVFQPLRRGRPRK